MKSSIKRMVLSVLAVITLSLVIFTTTPTTNATNTNPLSNIVFSPCVGYTRVWNSKYPCEGDLVIPAYHNGLPVTQIWTRALNYTNITSVVIPDTVTSLASGYNFDGCRQMKSAVISNNLSIIPNNAFSNCDELQSVDLGTGVTSIYCNAFSCCPKLTHIELPLSIQEIRSNAFYSGWSTGLQCAYYPGTIAQWQQVKVEDIAVLDKILYVTEIKEVVSSASGVAVSADPRPGAEHYTFYRQEQIAGQWTAWEELGSTQSATYVDTSAVSGRTYRYAVKATNREYTTSLSAESKAITYEKVSSFTLSKTVYTYDGKRKTPSVTVKTTSGKTLIMGTDYNVSYSSSTRKAAGTYKVTIELKGDYSGSETLTFKINPLKSTTCTFKLSTTVYTYNGKTKTPTVTVKSASGAKLTKGTHYTVSYSSSKRTAVGTYKVTVKMKGNYSGTKTLTFKINPKATSIKKLTAEKKALTVKLNKQTTQTSGYQIQYATSKTFKSYKTTTITSNKTTTKTIKKLKAKTTYYVRVRSYKTVNGTKFYSAWSSYKYLKTK